MPRRDLQEEFPEKEQKEIIIQNYYVSPQSSIIYRHVLYIVKSYANEYLASPH